MRSYATVFSILSAGLLALFMLVPQSATAQDGNCLHCPGLAPNFDGSSSGAQDGNNEVTSNQPNAELTFEMWFKSPDLTAAADTSAEVLWAQGEDDGSEGLAVYLNDGAVYAGVWSDSTSLNEHWLSTSAIQSGTWHHVAFVFDANSNQTTLYLDGEPMDSGVPDDVMPEHGAGSGNGLGGPNGEKRYHDSNLTGIEYTGHLDQFRAWRTALSSSEVRSRRHRSLWNQEFDPNDDAVTVDSDTLDLHWPFNLSDAESNPGWGYVGVSGRGIAAGNFDSADNGGIFEDSDAPITTQLLAAGFSSEAENARGPDGSTIEAIVAGDTLLVSYYGSSSGSPMDLDSGGPTEARTNLAWVIDPKNERASSPDLTIDYSSIDGISETSNLVMLKRNDPEESWSEANGWTHDESNRTFTKSGEAVAAYAEYSIGGPRSDLPVEMAGFDAVQNGKSVELTWQTASETNNAGFTVQHETESGWQSLGFIESKASGGTTTESTSYRYTVEENLDPGTHRFRLQQKDLDGSTSLSEVATVDVGMNEAIRLSAPAPNPTRGSATLEFGVKEATEVTVSVYNVLGQRVETLYQGTPQAEQLRDVTLDASSLSSGVYFVRMKAGGQTTTQRLTVVR